MREEPVLERQLARPRHHDRDRLPVAPLDGRRERIHAQCPRADHHRIRERAQVEHQRAVGTRADLGAALVAHAAVGGHHEIERDVRTPLVRRRIEEIAVQRLDLIRTGRAEARELRH